MRFAIFSLNLNWDVNIFEFQLLPDVGDRTETEYVSQMLTKVKRFAQHHACHVWFVAHPRQVPPCHP